MSLTIIKIEKLLVGLIKERKKFEYNLGKKTQIDKLFFFLMTKIKYILGQIKKIKEITLET